MKIDVLRTVASNYRRCTCVLKRGGMIGARVEERLTVESLSRKSFLYVKDSWRIWALSFIFTVHILDSMHILFCEKLFI